MPCSFRLAYHLRCCCASQDKHTRAGDFILNLSVDVSSFDLIQYCKQKGLLYLDTCVEPWAGGHHDRTKSLSYRSNYGLRERARSVRPLRPASR